MIAFLLMTTADVRAYWTPMTVAQLVHESSVIAVVKVVTKHWDPHAPKVGDQRQVGCRVVKLLAGRPEGNRIEIHFGDDFICSGNWYAVGETWLVFLRRQSPGIYRTVNYQGGQVSPSAHNIHVVENAVKRRDYSGQLGR